MTSGYEIRCKLNAMAAPPVRPTEGNCRSSRSFIGLLPLRWRLMAFWGTSRQACGEASWRRPSLAPRWRLELGAGVRIWGADHPAIAAARPAGGKIARASALQIGARTCLADIARV
jgi:hypothetical protein